MLGVPIVAVALLSPLVPNLGALPGAVDPPTGPLRIEIMTTIGVGCQGGVDARLAPGNSAFEVIYHDFLAKLGPGVPRIEARKHCQVAVELTAPKGYTYAISRADYAGALHLEKGATARTATSFYTSGFFNTTHPSKNFTGPLDGTWAWSESVDTPSLQFYPCGERRYINLDGALQLSAGTPDPGATSMISFTPDATPPGGAVSATYHLAWLTCPATAR